MLKRALLLLAFLPFFANAAQTVTAQTDSPNNPDSTSQTLTVGTAVAGDVAICGLIVDGSDSITWPPGWTEKETVNVSGQVIGSVAVRTMVGGDPTTITVTTGAAQSSAGKCFQLTNSGTSTVSNDKTNSGIQTSIDPDSLTLSGSYTVFVFVGSDQHKFGWTQPTGYTGGDLRSHASGGSVTLAHSYKAVTTTDDPSAVSHSGGGDDLIAMVVAVPESSDSTAPTLSSASVSDVTATADLNVTTDEGNGTLYHVVTSSATGPSAAQVKAGQDHAGSAAEADDSVAITTSGAKTFDDVAISAGTWYAHFMHEDAAANQSTVVTTSSFVISSTTATFDASNYDPGDTVTVTGTGYTNPLTQLRIPGAGSGVTFADRELGVVAPYFARTGAATDTNSGTLSTVDRSNNIFTKSNDLTDASWSMFGATRSQFNGVLTLTENSSNSRHFLYRSISGVAAADYYTFSVDVKAGTRGFVSLGLKQVTGASPLYAVNVDLSDGSVADTFSLGSPTFTAHAVSDEGDGWYRISVTIQGPTGNLYAEFGVSNSASPAWSGAVASYLGDGTGTILLRRPQISEGTTALPYDETGDDNAAPAFDGTNGVLIEASSTNVIRNSDTGTGWSFSGGAQDGTVASIWGDTSAVKFVEDTSSNSHHSLLEVGVHGDQPDATAGVAWAIVDLTGLSVPRFQFVSRLKTNVTYPTLTFQISDLAITSDSFDHSGVERLSGGQILVWGAMDDYGTGTARPYSLVRPADAGGSSGYTGDGTSSYVVHHLQFEPGKTVPSSAIRTSGSAVTRSQSSINAIPVTALGIEAPTNDIVIAFNVKGYWGDAVTGSQQGIISLYVDPNRTVEIYKHNSVAGRIQARVRRSAGNSDVYLSVDSVDMTGNIFGAIRLSSVGAKLWVNGSSAESTTADAQAAFDTGLTTLSIGSIRGGSPLDGKVLGFKVFGANTLSDTAIAALTASDLTDTLSYIPAESGATSSSADFVIPALTEFVQGGTMGHVQFGVSGTYTVTDGTDTATDTITVDAPANSGTSYFTDSLACAEGSCPGDSAVEVLPLTGAAVNDDALCIATQGTFSMSTSLVPFWITTPGSLDCRLFDESTSAWSAVGTEAYPEPSDMNCDPTHRSSWRPAHRNSWRNATCATYR